MNSQLLPGLLQCTRMARVPGASLDFVSISSNFCFRKVAPFCSSLVVITCLVCFFLESGPQGASLGRTLRPLFRAMKGIRLASKVAVNEMAHLFTSKRNEERGSEGERQGECF